MKKIISLLLSTILMLTMITGCSNNDTTDNKTNRNPAIGTGEMSDLLGEQPPEGALAVVNGETLFEEDLNDTLSVLRYVYQKNPSDEDWESFYNYAIQYMTSSKMYYLMLDDYNLTIDESVVDENLEKAKNATGNTEDFYAEIAEFDLTEEQIRQFLMDEQAYIVLYEHAIRDLEITDEEINEYFEANKEGFTNVTTRDFYQIQFDTKEEAEAALEEIRNGKTFEDILEGIEDAGDGYNATVSEGDLIEVFDKVVWSLKEDETYDEVVTYEMKSEDGALIDTTYHIVKVKNFVIDKTYTVDEVKDTISSYLMEVRKGETMQQFINDGIVKYSVTIY